MERHDPSPADGRLALGHGAPVARRGPDVVAGREQMAGIQADAEPLGPSRALDERGQLAERAADRVAGAGGVLERDLDAIARGARERLVERGGDPSEPGLEPGAHVRARMEDDAREAERLRALELVGERGHRLGPQGRIRISQVDEVARMGEDVSDRCRTTGCGERPRFIRREGLGRPLSLVFQEDLDRAAAELAPALEGQMQPTRDGYVSADLVPAWSHGGHGSTLYSAPMKPFQVPSAFTTTFTLEYGVSEADMRRLYENAKRDQWNASKDIPWTDALPSDGRVIADELIDIYGSPPWESPPEADKVALHRRLAAWRLSVLMHGEQGALLACSQMVDIVQGADQKFFQATQVLDEARHNEVLSRYLADRLEGLTYPMPVNEKDLFDSILSESR